MVYIVLDRLIILYRIDVLWIYFFIIALTWLHFVYFTEPKHNKCQMYQMPVPKPNDDMYARLNSEGAMVSKTDVVVYIQYNEWTLKGTH